MGATRRTGGQQQGAQEHGEGQHGRKTREHIAAAWNHPGGNETSGGANTGAGNDAGEKGPQYDRAEISAHAPPSNNHIFSGRTQHDDADLNSEKTRLARAVKRDGQVAEGEWARKSVRASAKRKS